MTEYLTLRTGFEDLLGPMPPDVLRIFLALAARSQADNETPLTLAELADQTEVHPRAVKRALDWLAAPPEGLNPLLKWGKKAGQRALKIDPSWIGDKRRAVPFSEEVGDAARIAALEAEIRRLGREVERAKLGERSDLTTVLKGEDRDVAFEIEAYYGRALTPAEAWYLGQLVALYNPERVKATFRGVKGSRDPLRAAYAILRNGGKGKAYVPKDTAFRAVKYREIA